LTLEDLFYFVNNWIRTYGFVGFGMYSLFTLALLNLDGYKNKVEDFDDAAVKVLAFIGFVLFVYLSFEFYKMNKDAETINFYKRTSGRYLIYVYLQPVFWFVSIVLLNIKKLRRNFSVRALLSLPLLVSIEKIVIVSSDFRFDDFFARLWRFFRPEELIYYLLVFVLICLPLYFLKYYKK